MNEDQSNTFLYEHCDVPQGQSLAEWRTSRAVPSRRRPHGGSGIRASLAALAPFALAARGTRHSR
jgi:hypothetical protein